MRALSAQTEASAKRVDDWIWLGSEEKSRSTLVIDVVDAFEVYSKEDTTLSDLVSISKMEQVSFGIIVHPLAPRPWGASRSEDDNIERVPQREADEDVVIQAYDLSSLGLTAKLEELEALSEVLKSPLVGILQNARTLKLHSALQRLALFLGEKRACMWIMVKGENWLRLGLHEHRVYPLALSSAAKDGSSAEGADLSELQAVNAMNSRLRIDIFGRAPTSREHRLYPLISSMPPIEECRNSYLTQLLCFQTLDSLQREAD